MTLPEGLTYLPDRKRRELQRAVRILFDEFEEAQKTKLSEKARRGRILKLILFGSYARNDWVEDRKSGYLSDFDILVIVNYENFAEQYEAWEKAADRFARELGITGHIKTPVNFIVHSYEDVNSQLSQGRPFFVDIARDGIVLYETAGYDLAAPRQLSHEEARAEGGKHFEHWFPTADRFMKLAKVAIGNKFQNEAAFLLHQAAERLYHCVLQYCALQPQVSPPHLPTLSGRAPRPGADRDLAAKRPLCQALLQSPRPRLCRSPLFAGL